MYATIPLGKLIKLLFWLFVGLAIVIWWARGQPAEPGDLLKVMTGAVTATGVFLVILFGSSGKWSPWRWIWRACPVLNDFLFPDLNGRWEGEQESNWSKIDAMKRAAFAEGAAPHDHLEKIELRQLPISIEIKASLFDLHIYGLLPTTDSNSVSTAARLMKADDGRFLLFYVFVQETGKISSTDEGNHDGAAKLTYFANTNELKGTYWTKRMWQAGLNTAGRLSVRRVSRERTTYG